jgi:hypothetical protein
MMLFLSPAAYSQQPKGYWISDGYGARNLHAVNCDCTICEQLRQSGRLPAKTTPEAQTQPQNQSVPPIATTKEEKPKEEQRSNPPAPVERTAKPVKLPQAAATSQAEVMRHLSENQALAPSTRRNILGGLENANHRTASNDGNGFDLLEAMRGRSTSANVADEKFKEANPPKEAPPLPMPPKAEPKAVKAEAKKPQPAPDLSPTDKPKSTKTEDGPAAMALTAAEQDDKYEVPPAEIGITVGSKIDPAESWDSSKPVPYGRLVQFWVKPITKRPANLRSVAYTWTVFPREDVLRWSDSTRIIISSGVKPQSSIVILTASYVYLEGDKITQRTSQAITALHVGDGVVQLQGFAQKSRDWVALIPRSDDYNDEQIKEDAAKLAGAFRSVAAESRDNKVTDIDVIVQKSKIENGRVLANNVERWAPWFAQMKDTLTAAYRKGEIRTADDYLKAMSDIATGLETAAK